MEEQPKQSESIIGILLQRQHSLLQQLSISFATFRLIAVGLAAATFIVDRFAPAIGVIGMVLCITWFFQSVRLKRLLLAVEEMISRGESGEWEELYIKFRNAERYAPIIWRFGGFEPMIWMTACAAGTAVRIFFP